LWAFNKLVFPGSQTGIVLGNDCVKKHPLAAGSID
jgi:hypothetical protein